MAVRKDGCLCACDIGDAHRKSPRVQDPRGPIISPRRLLQRQFAAASASDYFFVVSAL